jgi:hypothetical protein
MKDYSVGGSTCGKGIKGKDAVDGLHTLIQNKTKKLLAIALSGAGRRLRGRDGGGDLDNIQ